MTGPAGPVYAIRVITLHHPPPAWGLPSPTPFGIKVETYLRMVGLPYRTRGADPRKNPKGKVPWIVDDGHMVSDSSDIIDHLKARHGDPLDAELTAEQRALALVARRALEEHLYWVLVYTRWIEPEGYRHVREYFVGLMPPVLGGVIVDRLIRKKIRAALHAQGVGRHAPADIYRRGCEDLTAVAALLGDKPYLLGEQPTSVDASLFAFTAGLWLFPADNPLKRHLARHGNLVAYVERMYTRYYADHPPGASKPA